MSYNMIAGRHFAYICDLHPLCVQHVGPILIFCSEDDELAPCSIVQNFGRRLLELGGDVNLVKWHSSPHVGTLFVTATIFQVMWKLLIQRLNVLSIT